MFWLSDVFTGTDSARLMRQYEVRARAARTRATRRTFSAFGHVLKSVGMTATRGTTARLRAWNERRKLVHALDNMEDRLLVDIGLARDDVETLNRGEWPERIAEKSEKPAARIAMGAELHGRDGNAESRCAPSWRRAA